MIHGTASGAGLYAVRRYLTRQALRVVTYHGVDSYTDPVANLDRLQADPGVFARQLDALAGAFRVVDLGEAVQCFVRDGTWPDRALAITFDDGYRNNLEVAAPILSAKGLPATFFVTAGFVEERCTPWWYDLREFLAHSAQASGQARAQAIRLEAELRPMADGRRESVLSDLGVVRGASKAYPFMTRDECRQLIAMGFDVQPHGDTHVSLGAESNDRVAQEIRASVAFVRDVGGKPWGLAYPYGHRPSNLAAAVEVMRSEGLLAGLTTETGVNSRRVNPWLLRRFDLHGGYDPLAAVARVS